MRPVCAVDVGGTFTDLVLLDVDTGAVDFTKSPTTPREPARGVLAAVRKSGLAVTDLEVFFHGTTLGINALLERRGAKTGLITTKGFRDVLELRRLSWPSYQLFWEKPEPLVPRYLRREVSERLHADGGVLEPLDEDELRREARRLVDDGVESIAVCFMHAYAYPRHELRAGEVIVDECPGVSVTLSHQVTLEYREYERTATTVADATIKPRIARYIDDLEGNLTREQFGGVLSLTRCDGGVMSAAEAKERPIRTLVSGPASGVMGAVTLSRWLALPAVIGIDMGGTSFEASLVVNNEPTLRTMTEIGDVPLLMPLVELATIGAGGGSIAWLDSGGALNVGPRSAGADPGPVAYGKGGSQATFTDAALVSGLLDPGRFLDGEIALDLAAARAAIQTMIGDPLGLTGDEAAAGIVSLTEAKMAATLEEVTIAKGHDPREFSLIAYGGGGSLVAAALARRLEIPRVVVPPSPGTFSAWGMLTLDVVHDFALTSVSPLDELAADDLQERFGVLERRAAAALERERVAPDRRMMVRSMDMRYEGQEHVLTVSLDAQLDPSRMRAVFDARHEVTYGYAMPDPVEVAAYRVRAVGSLDKPARPSITVGGSSAEHALRGARTVVHRESGGSLNCAVYDRRALMGGNCLAGPAIVEEAAATTLIGPSQSMTVDEMGNLVIP